MNVDKKKCPFCAEEILVDAIKCKFCKEELSNDNTKKKLQKKIEIQNLKLCPYCKEKINLQAIKCKHCGENLVKDIKSVEEKVLTGAANTFFEINDIIWKTLIVILVLLGIMYACVKSI